MIWKGLPTIRKELAKSMINNYGLCQREAAEILGLTPAAVCQYLSKKRSKINIEDKNIISEINKSAKIIINNGNSSVSIETCRLCQLLIKKISFINQC
jgi:predicted transcriptional regulator